MPEFVQASPLPAASWAAAAAEAHAAVTLPAVGVADRAGQRVGGIRAGITRQLQQPPDHRLHLLLARLAGAYNRLLDLQRGVLGHRQSARHCGTDCGAAGLAQQQRGFGIDVDEDLLDRRALGVIAGDDFLQAFEQDLQALGQFALAAADAAAGDIGQFLAALFDDPEAGDAQSGVDAEDAERRRAQAGSSRTAVV